MSHSFSHPHHEIHFTTYQPADVAPALEQAESEARAGIEKFLAIADAARTFENTLLAFSRCDEALTVVAEIVGHLDSVLSGPWVEVVQLVEQKITAFSTEVMHDERIYRALKAVPSDDLPPHKQRLLRETIRDFERTGIALPEAEKQKVKELTREISKLTVQFEQNIIAANRDAGVHVATKAELDGCDESLIDAARQAAAERQLEGFWVGYSEPNAVKILKDCRVRTTREAMHRVASTRSLRNQPVTEKILKARYDLARMLGFKNHAEYVLEKRMAKKPETAIEFMQNLVTHYKPRAQEEHESLQNFAREYENDPAVTLGPADVDMGLPLYYANLQREKLHGFNEKTVSDYLPLPAVREAMFDVLTKLYGLKFTPGAQKTWHEDVEIYEVADENGRHIATVWCDWYARDGKRGGAWQNTYFTDDATPSNAENRHPTLGYVVCNFPAPHETTPSLLGLRDVETMWHEFGHFIHAALSRTELHEQSGSSCKWDFVEAPSQIMENWVWRPEIFTSFARHYATNEPLSAQVVQKIMGSRQFRTASASLRQCYFALLDLTLYTSPPTDNVVEFARRMKKDFMFVPPAEYEASITNFAHIFSGGYSAGYYGYKWSEAIEADFFSRFENEGVLSREVGRDYAEKVLARGDEVDPEQLVRDFLGRETSIEPLLKREGLA